MELSRILMILMLWWLPTQQQRIFEEDDELRQLLSLRKNSNKDVNRKFRSSQVWTITTPIPPKPKTFRPKFRPLKRKYEQTAATPTTIQPRVTDAMLHPKSPIRSLPFLRKATSQSPTPDPPVVLLSKDISRKRLQSSHDPALARKYKKNKSYRKKENATVRTPHSRKNSVDRVRFPLPDFFRKKQREEVTADSGFPGNDTNPHLKKAPPEASKTDVQEFAFSSSPLVDDHKESKFVVKLVEPPRELERVELKPVVTSVVSPPPSQRIGMAKGKKQSNDPVFAPLKETLEIPKVLITKDTAKSFQNSWTNTNFSRSKFREESSFDDFIRKQHDSTPRKSKERQRETRVRNPEEIGTQVPQRNQRGSDLVLRSSSTRKPKLHRAPIGKNEATKTGDPPGHFSDTNQEIKMFSFENSDGSFTFGYVGADGSFREETRGADCIVRGVYGYVDPDGMSRRFTYSTGNHCDHAAEKQETSRGTSNFPVRPEPISGQERRGLRKSIPPKDSSNFAAFSGDEQFHLAAPPVDREARKRDAFPSNVGSERHPTLTGLGFDFDQQLRLLLNQPVLSTQQKTQRQHKQQQQQHETVRVVKESAPESVLRSRGIDFDKELEALLRIKAPEPKVLKYQLGFHKIKACILQQRSRPFEGGATHGAVLQGIPSIDDVDFPPENEGDTKAFLLPKNVKTNERKALLQHGILFRNLRSLEYTF